MVKELILLPSGEIVRGELDRGIAWRSVPSRFLPPEYAAEMVWEATDSVPRLTGVTRAKARVRLQQAGIHPYPKDIEQYRRERTMTAGDKQRHAKKVAEKVRKGRRLDEKARRAVEG